MMCSVRPTGTNSAGLFSFFFLSAAARGSRGAGGERARAGLRGIMSGTGREKKEKEQGGEQYTHAQICLHTDSGVRRRRLSHQKKGEW